jgi:hypothetical protein
MNNCTKCKKLYTTNEHPDYSDNLCDSCYNKRNRKLKELSEQSFFNQEIFDAMPARMQPSETYMTDDQIESMEHYS